MTVSWPTREGHELAVAAEFPELLERPCVGLGRAVGEHVLGEALAGEGGGLRGQRLGVGRDFAGDGAGGVLAVFDGEQRLAGGAIEEEDEAVFGGLGDGVDRFAVVA